MQSYIQLKDVESISMYFNEYNLPIYVESPIDVESLPVERKDVESISMYFNEYNLPI